MRGWERSYATVSQGSWSVEIWKLISDDLSYFNVQRSTTIDREVFTLIIIRVKKMLMVLIKISQFRSIHKIFKQLMFTVRLLGEFLVFSLLSGIRRARYC